MDSLIGSGAFVGLGAVDTYTVRVTSAANLVVNFLTTGNQADAETAYAKAVATGKMKKVELLKNGAVVKTWTLVAAISWGVRATVRTTNYVTMLADKTDENAAMATYKAAILDGKYSKVELLRSGVVYKTYTPSAPAAWSPEQAEKDRRFYYKLYDEQGEELYSYTPLNITTYAAALAAAQAKAETMWNARSAKIWSTDGGGEPGSTGKAVSVRGAATDAPYSFTVDDAATGKRYFSSGGFYANGTCQNAAISKATALASQYGANMKYVLLQNGKIIGGDTVATTVTAKATESPQISPSGEPPAQPSGQPVIPVSPSKTYLEPSASVQPESDTMLTEDNVRLGAMAAIGFAGVGALVYFLSKRK